MVTQTEKVQKGVGVKVRCGRIPFDFPPFFRVKLKVCAVKTALSEADIHPLLPDPLMSCATSACVDELLHRVVAC